MGSRCGPIGIGLRAAVRRECRWAGFSRKAEAQRALQNELARRVPGGRSATLTLGEWVEEYLESHQGERATVAKLRWLGPEGDRRTG
jgi:hypothetical protein